MRVLFADDDPLMRLVLEQVLRAAGHEPIAAEDGLQAWTAFEREKPPLVILDWLMPGLDGLEVCRRIRAHPLGDVTFVLVVTARDLTSEDRRRLEGQVRQVLQKGAFSRDELAREIRRHAARAS